MGGGGVGVGEGGSMKGESYAGIHTAVRRLLFGLLAL